MLFYSHILNFLTNKETFFQNSVGVQKNIMSDVNELPLEEIYKDENEHSNLIKVSSRSRSTAVAGAIAGVIRQHSIAEVQAIGAGAVNQAVKALAIAHGYLQRDEIDIVCVPFFTEVDINGHERTAVRFRIEIRTEAAV
jgi:stage V sporulation protein S